MTLSFEIKVSWLSAFCDPILRMYGKEIPLSKKGLSAPLWCVPCWPQWERTGLRVNWMEFSLSDLPFIGSMRLGALPDSPSHFFICKLWIITALVSSDCVRIRWLNALELPATKPGILQAFHKCKLLLSLYHRPVVSPEFFNLWTDTPEVCNYPN